MEMGASISPRRQTGLARRRADPPADRRERIRPPRDRVGLAEPPLRDQRDVLAGLRVDGARPLAGEVPLEPLAAEVGHRRSTSRSRSRPRSRPPRVTAFCGGLQLRVPHLHGVGAVRDVGDVVGAVRLRSRRSRAWARRRRMPPSPGGPCRGASATHSLLERVALRLPLGPGAEVELVGARVRREDVVQDRVRVEEVDGRADEHRQDVGHEDQVLLVDLSRAPWAAGRSCPGSAPRRRRRRRCLAPLQVTFPCRSPAAAATRAPGSGCRKEPSS